MASCENGNGFFESLLPFHRSLLFVNDQPPSSLPASPTSLRALLDLFVDPVPALSRADRAPRSGWLPYLVLVVFQILVAALYFGRVDTSWLVARILSHVPQAARSAAAAHLSVGLLEGSTVAGMVLGTAVGLVISAAYYYIMLILSKRETTFFRMLSLAAWTSLPAVLGSVAALAIVLAAGSHIGLSALEPTALAYLFHIHPGNRFYDAASSFSLLMPWTWGLATLAFVRLYGYRPERALALVLIPYVIYYVVIVLL